MDLNLSQHIIAKSQVEMMHGQMLNHMVHALDLKPSLDTTVWQALALSNTMIGLATTRRYAYQSIGALGVIELTAPGRVDPFFAALDDVPVVPEPLVPDCPWPA